MNVIIAGIDGYLGWPLALHLKARGHRVAGIDNLSRRYNVGEHVDGIFGETKLDSGGNSIIPKIFLMVCSACQNDCRACVTENARKKVFPSYQMTMEQVENFIFCVSESKYLVGTLLLCGLGEPTLWRFFNEGVAVLKRSGLFGQVVVLTNGQSLNRIDSETFELLDEIRVSVLTEETKAQAVRLQERFGSDRIKQLDKAKFRETTEETGSIPCACQCVGPTVIGDKVFPYCAGEGPATITQSGQTILDFPEMHSPLKPHFLKNHDPIFRKNTRNFELCRWCWGNGNTPRREVNPLPEKQNG